jgi:formylglycine-generating enzyme required for sulfatase activity
VGCFAAGATVCGAQDMAGNAMEWMATSNERHQQVEPEKDFTSGTFVLRSYSDFRDPKEELLSGSRIRSFPSFGLDSLGFRVLQSLRSSEV